MSRRNRIEELIHQALLPIYLNIEDESSNHHVPQGSQTHFKLIVVSSHFSDLSQLSRHRVINHMLQKEFELGLHALSMHLFTPDEWEKRKHNLLQSPICRGGMN